MYELTHDENNYRHLVTSGDRVIKIFGYQPEKEATDRRGTIGTAYRAVMWIIDNDPARADK